MCYGNVKTCIQACIRAELMRDWDALLHWIGDLVVGREPAQIRDTENADTDTPGTLASMHGFGK